MKKLSYVLGLVAMAIMMTMTSCSNVNEEVKKVCDALDNAAVEVEKAESAKEVKSAMQSAGEVMKGVDKEVALTEDDKDAIKESFMNYSNATMEKLVELKEITKSEAEKTTEQIETTLDKKLADSETLGDFLGMLQL